MTEPKKSRITLPAVLLVLCGAAVMVFGILTYRGSLQPEPVPEQPVLEQPSVLPEQPEPRELETDVVLPEQPEETEPAPVVHTVRLMAVGDNLIHNTVYWSAEKDDGSYDFTPFYEDISRVTATYDLSCINQETIFVNDPALYDNYPNFGSPTAVGDALVQAGFDVVECANNHTYDKLNTGILDTIAFWREYHPETTVLGIHDSEQDAQSIRTVERNGVTVALLNYTYNVNNQRPASGYMIDFLDGEKCAADIERAHELADFVIVFVHWGTENSYEPDAQQKQWAEFFAAHDVDAVIGSHPHVVQPMAVYTNASGREMPVYFSLGNFLSHQMGAEKMLGAMASMTLVMDETGTHVDEIELIPTVNFLWHNDERGLWNYAPMPLKYYTEEMAAKHRFPEATVEYLWELFGQATAWEQN